MSAKDKRNILVKFYAEKEVKAYTLDHARKQVEDMKLIKAEQGITTMSNWEVIQESLILNSPAIIIMGLGIIYAMVMVSVLNYIVSFQESDPAAHLIGLMAWILMLLRTLRFPETVGRYFKRDKY